MPSIHSIRWIENLKNTNHELYWFDVINKGKLDVSIDVTQYINWEKRKIRPLKGEYTFAEKFPFAFEKIKFLLKVTENEYLEKIIKDIQPDVIHSFEMQSCSYPILKTMNKYPHIKWIYSCWGSDLYYYQNYKKHRNLIQKVLKRVNFLHTDCYRDFIIAKQLGFAGKHTGVIPGGTGYDLEKMDEFKTPIKERKIILVKGYEHHLGRGLNIVKALHLINTDLYNFQIVVFGAHNAVIQYVFDNNLPYKVFHRNELSQNELMQLMGKSLIYIGNSISDGIPNTLLEAVVMNAFPIQSNPGNVTEEIIKNGVNGLIINNPESINEIKNLILDAVNNFHKLENAAIINTRIASERLELNLNMKKVLEIYNGKFNKV